MYLTDALQQFKEYRTYKTRNKTNYSYEGTLRQFIVYMKNCHITEVTLSDIITWFSLQTDVGYENNTFIPRAIALRKFFELFYKQGYVVVNPELIPIPHKDYTVPRVTNDKDFRLLLHAIPTKTSDPRHVRNRALILLLWDTGCRLGEALSIQAPDIDLKSKKAVIKTEKSRGKRPFREVFWTQQTNTALKRWIMILPKYAKDNNALFVCINFHPGNTFSIKGAGEMLRKYCNRAGLPYMNAHSFRHHKGHDIINKGGSASDVMNILGHASLQSSSVYTMMHDNELKNRAQLFLKK